MKQLRVTKIYSSLLLGQTLLNSETYYCPELDTAMIVSLSLSLCSYLDDLDRVLRWRDTQNNDIHDFSR